MFDLSHPSILACFASFDDARLTARALRIVSDCARNPDLSLASLYQGDLGSLKACYRFFDNADVSSAQIWLHPGWGWLGVSVAERLFPALTRPSIPRRRRSSIFYPSRSSHSMRASSRVGIERVRLRKSGQTAGIKSRSPSATNAAPLSRRRSQAVSRCGSVREVPHPSNGGAFPRGRERSEQRPTHSNLARPPVDRPPGNKGHPRRREQPSPPPRGGGC